MENRQTWMIKNPKLCKNGYLIQKWLFAWFGLSKWPRGPFSRSVPITTCRLLFPTWLLPMQKKWLRAALNLVTDQSKSDTCHYRLFTLHSPYFSVRSSRSSTLCSGQPSWMSVKTTSGAGDGLEESEKNSAWVVLTLTQGGCP